MPVGVEQSGDDSFFVQLEDRLKKATLTPVTLYQSDGEEMPERSTESDSDFEQVAPRTRNVPNRVRAVKIRFRLILVNPVV